MHLFLAAASGKFTGRLFKKTFKIFREHELHPGRSHLEMFQLDHLMGHHWLRAANKHSVIRTTSIHKQCHECGEHWPVSRNCALGQELLCVSLRSQCGQAAHKSTPCMLRYLASVTGSNHVVQNSLARS